MFGLSMGELMVIGVVALIVIGPERLPKVARTVGHLVGRAQRYVTDIKSDIQREMDIQELSKIKDDIQSGAQEIKSSFEKSVASIKDPFEEIKQDLGDTNKQLKQELGELPDLSDLKKPLSETISETISETATAPSVETAQAQELAVANQADSASSTSAESPTPAVAAKPRGEPVSPVAPTGSPLMHDMSPPSVETAQAQELAMANQADAVAEPSVESTAQRETVATTVPATDKVVS